MAAEQKTSPFIPLPVPNGKTLRILGPPPEEAAVAVDPLVRFDVPHGAVQSFVAGLCRTDGRLIQPMEVYLVLDPATVGPHAEVPVVALMRSLRALPEVQARLPIVPGFELIRETLGVTGSIGPALYCRKRHTIFAARSPNDASPLAAVDSPAKPAADPSDGEPLPIEFLSWDGLEGDRSPAIYGGAGGPTAAGEAASLEQLILDQGKVVAQATALAKTDPVAVNSLASSHTCCACPERKRCFPGGDGYAYALDRLVIASAAETPIAAAPLGEWRLDEVTRIIAGVTPHDLFGEAAERLTDFDAWRRDRARAIETVGPPLLLAGETDGRQLLELARLKLGLIADVLEQLDAGWRAAERPHLCWNDDTVRVAWRRPVAAPAAYWGFQPLLRKIGLHPLSDVSTLEGVQAPYPPAFSDAALLPPEATEAMRYFGQPRTAGVYVKSAGGGGDKPEIHILLEDLGIARTLFCRDDVMKVSGEGWQLTLKPAPEHDPDDGEGIPFIGTASGRVGGLQAESQFDGCTTMWYPYFGEAVDLHAVGMLLLETLVAHDERVPKRLRADLIDEREELTLACAAVPEAQRDDEARGWIATRCDVDTPASIWSRRKLLYKMEDRAAAQLDGFPTNLWKATVTLALRLVTSIPGFSFCADRSVPAPRLSNGQLLPLVELRGLISLLDDLIYGRVQPGQSLREALKPAK